MEVENEYERTLNMYNCYTISIRQHGSAVYVGMVVVVCIYIYHDTVDNRS